MHIDEQIKEANRELNTRKNVYPFWISKGKIKPHIADHRIKAQEAIIQTLEKYKADHTEYEQKSLGLDVNNCQMWD